MSPRSMAGDRSRRPSAAEPAPGAEAIDATSADRGRPRGPAVAGGEPVDLDPFDAGVLIGLLVGEGHFGGDGRQPQVTLRMHTNHAAVFAWLMERFPDSRLYGPYDHAGRRYYQWMARGPFLRERLLPLLEARLRPEHSERVWGRYQAMRRAYGLGVGPGGPGEASVGEDDRSGRGS